MVRRAFVMTTLTAAGVAEIDLSTFNVDQIRWLLKRPGAPVELRSRLRERLQESRMAGDVGSPAGWSRRIEAPILRDRC